MKLSVDEVPNLRERATSILRDAILRRHFAPGQRMVERTLSEETGVSRTVIREALAQLESEGLVRRISARGTGMEVTSLTPPEAEQLYEMRRIIEPAMAELFAERGTEEDFQRLAAAISGLDALIDVEDALAQARNQDAISEAIMMGSHNDMALQTLGLLRSRSIYLRTITSFHSNRDRRQETSVALQGIFEAIHARDGAAARVRMTAYIERSARFAKEILAAETLRKAED